MVDQVNTTTKKVSKESDPNVIHYIDRVGNQEESVLLETMILTSGETRTWLRKHKNYVKGEIKTIDKDGKPKLTPINFQESKKLWETYLP